VDSVCPQPLFLPVEQNPLAAYLLARIPRPVFRVLDLYEEQAPLPIFAFHLAILSPRGPRCSSRAKAETWAPELMGGSSAAECYGMHTTPDYFGKSEPPNRLPSCIGTP